MLVCRHHFMLLCVYPHMPIHTYAYNFKPWPHRSLKLWPLFVFQVVGGDLFLIVVVVSVGSRGVWYVV